MSNVAYRLTPTMTSRTHNAMFNGVEGMAWPVATRAQSHRIGTTRSTSSRLGVGNKSAGAIAARIGNSADAISSARRSSNGFCTTRYSTIDTTSGPGDRDADRKVAWTGFAIVFAHNKRRSAGTSNLQIETSGMSWRARTARWQKTGRRRRRGIFQRITGVSGRSCPQAGLEEVRFRFDFEETKG
jgi:hypothetical protein